MCIPLPLLHYCTLRGTSHPPLFLYFVHRLLSKIISPLLSLINSKSVRSQETSIVGPFRLSAWENPLPEKTKDKEEDVGPTCA